VDKTASHPDPAQPAGEGHALGVALVVGSAAGFGLLALFKSWSAAGGAGTIATLALRFVIASVVLWVLVARRGEAVPRGRGLWIRLAMGAVLYYAESRCYFGAIDAGTPSGLVALLLYTAPAMVALGARVCFREPLTPARVAALSLATLGAALTTGPLQLAGGGGSAVGIVLSLMAAVGYAAYILAGAALSRRGTGDATPGSALATGALVCTGAAVSFVLEAGITGSPLPGTPIGWLGVGLIALVSTAFAITALLAGIARLGATRAASLAIVEPLVAVVVGWLVLGEAMTALRAAGGALILAGAVVAARAK